MFSLIQCPHLNSLGLIKCMCYYSNNNSWCVIVLRLWFNIRKFCINNRLFFIVKLLVVFIVENIKSFLNFF